MMFGNSIATLSHILGGLCRDRLAGIKSAVAQGDPLLKSSEGIMRLVAASVMSTARAQRCVACFRPAGYELANA